MVIDHGGGLQTTYAHCERLLVEAGQRVGMRQPIATVGQTGRATGPHVHVEARLHGAAVDPVETSAGWGPMRRCHQTVEPSRTKCDGRLKLWGAPSDKCRGGRNEDPGHGSSGSQQGHGSRCGCSGKRGEDVERVFLSDTAQFIQSLRETMIDQPGAR